MSALGTALKHSITPNVQSSEQIANNVTATARVADSLDSPALTQLLAELNSHSLALVPYRPPRAELAAPRTASALRLESILLWMLTTVVMAVIFSTLTIKYLMNDRSTLAAAVPPPRDVTGQAALVVDPAQKQVTALVDSVARLTAAYTSSTARMKNIEAGQARLLRRAEAPPEPVQRTALPVHTPEARSQDAPRPATQQPTNTAPTPASVPGTTTQASALPTESMITGIDMIRGTVEHRNANGTADYWLAPRIVAGTTKMVKVRPFATSLKGVWIHNLEEGQDYILTPGGGWISEAPQPASK